MSGDLQLAVAGDAMIHRRVSVRDDAPFGRLVDRIRDTDAAVVNLETTVHENAGYPAADAGMYMRSPPRAVEDLKWMGFDAVSAANNHVGDFSHGGMVATMEELEARDVPYAGLGRTLADARRPAYFDTAAGRVAVVAAAASYDPWTAAGERGRDVDGRPGLAPLDVSGHYVVPDDRIDDLRTMSESLGLEEMKRANEAAGFPHPDTENVFHLEDRGDGGDITFHAGDTFAFEWDVDDDHAAAVHRRIREATRQADWVVASLHAHHGGVGHFGDESVPSFVESFARECIDAGADLFMGHGPHVVRPIEVYDGQPIFYGLGDFVLHEESVPRLPAAMYRGHDADATPADVFDQREAYLFAEDGFWHSVLPVCRFADGVLDTVTLYPVDLQPDLSRSRRGTPVLATGERADTVLSGLAELSADYDTEITRDGNVGRVSFG